MVSVQSSGWTVCLSSQAVSAIYLCINTVFSICANAWLAIYASIYNILCEHEPQDLTGSMCSAWLLAGCWDMDLCSLPCARDLAELQSLAQPTAIFRRAGDGGKPSYTKLRWDQQKFVNGCLSDVPSASKEAAGFTCTVIGGSQYFSLTRDKAVSLCLLLSLGPVIAYVGLLRENNQGKNLLKGVCCILFILWSCLKSPSHHTVCYIWIFSSYELHKLLSSAVKAVQLNLVLHH